MHYSKSTASLYSGVRRQNQELTKLVQNVKREREIWSNTTRFSLGMNTPVGRAQAAALEFGLRVFYDKITQLGVEVMQFAAAAASVNDWKNVREEK